MMQYLKTFLFVNIHHGSKFDPRFLKTVAIPFPAQCEIFLISLFSVENFPLQMFLCCHAVCKSNGVF